MAEIIQEIFVDPPIAIARLGGSSAPQDAYHWVKPVNPRSDGNTVIAPWWTLEVLADGTVEPHMPTKVRLRDDDQIRPVPLRLQPAPHARLPCPEDSPA